MKSYEEWNKSEEPEEPTIPEGDVANGDFENDLDGWTKKQRYQQLKVERTITVRSILSFGLELQHKV